MHKTFSSTQEQESEPDPGQFAQRVLSLIVSGRRCQREIQGVLQAVPMTDSQLLVLWMVKQLCPPEGGPGVGQSDLVRSLGISAAQISGLVDQLRRSKDLIGYRSDKDRRQQRWKLTTAGEAKLTQALTLFSGLSVSLWNEFALLENLTSENSASEKQPADFLSEAAAPEANWEAA